MLDFRLPAFGPDLANATAGYPQLAPLSVPAFGPKATIVATSGPKPKIVTTSGPKSKIVNTSDTLVFVRRFV